MRTAGGIPPVVPRARETRATSQGYTSLYRRVLTKRSQVSASNAAASTRPPRHLPRRLNDCAKRGYKVCNVARSTSPASVSKTTHAAKPSGERASHRRDASALSVVARTLLLSFAGAFPAVNLQPVTRKNAAMLIYDIEFDIDSFLDEMEEKQRARRQRQQQIHRSADAGASLERRPARPRRRLTAGVRGERRRRVARETLADQQR